MNHLFEYALFGLYVLAGPTLAALFGFVLVKGHKRMMLLQPPAMALPANPPRVTIVIPAKDEVQRIGDCLRSALDQDYPDFDVLAVDDRSTDGTGRLMDEMGQADGNLKVIHIPSNNPPAGWTGKCHALHTAVEHATGQWLLFVDSDVVLKPHALSTTLAFALQREADLLSLLPRQDCHSFWESLLVPLAGGALSAMHLVALTNNDHLRHVSFANGQYMLFRRQVYDAIGGHQAVRDRFCEDIALAQLVKTSGYRIRIAVGVNLATVRMYDSLAAIQRGWARIFFAAGMGHPRRILLGIAFLLLCCYSACVAIVWGIYRSVYPVNAFGACGWLAAAGIHLGLLTGILSAVYSWSGNRRRNAILLPLGAAMLLGIFVKALRMCRTGKVEWRGTCYTHRQRVLVPERQ